MSDAPRLHNHNVVYILGAGASVDAGMPVVANFLHRMRDSLEWLESEKRAREVEAIRRVLQFRHEIASATYRVQADPENIEELFSLAAASAGESLTEHVNVAIAATLDYSRVMADLQPRIGHAYFPRQSTEWTPPAQWQSELDAQPDVVAMTANGPITVPKTPQATLERTLSELTYAFLTMRVWPSDSRKRVTFITFNYDLVAETMLDRLGLPWNYGTVDESDDEADENPSITLLKLHGSINWCRPRTDLKSGGHGRLKTFETYSELLSASETPLIIPPTWQKNFSDVFATVWDDAVRALNEATRVGIFGFSLPWSDTHFKYLLAAGLRNNISLRRVAFHTKNAEEPISRLWSIFRPELDGSLVTTSDGEIAEYVLGGNLGYFLGLGKPCANAGIG